MHRLPKIFAIDRTINQKMKAPSSSSSLLPDDSYSNWTTRSPDVSSGDEMSFRSEGSGEAAESEIILKFSGLSGPVEFSIPTASSEAVMKVSQVSSLMGRVGTAGLGKAVDVLDTLGSSMTNLTLSCGFASGMATKGIKISILAFEVANTIVKGVNLMHSLSEDNIRHLKEVVLPSEGVQRLISKDMDDLLRIAAADKRDELQIFSGEVRRFGNRCKDPQWHNLDRYFKKLASELSPHKQLKEKAVTVGWQLMLLDQYTAETSTLF